QRRGGRVIMSTGKIGPVYYPKTPLVQPKVKSTIANPGNITAHSLKPSFAQVLDHTLHKDSLKFSRHAQVRLDERGIHLSADQVERLQEGLTKAKDKGAKEALFL